MSASTVKQIRLDCYHPRFQCSSWRKQ